VSCATKPQQNLQPNPHSEPKVSSRPVSFARLYDDYIRNMLPVGLRCRVSGPTGRVYLHSETDAVFSVHIQSLFQMEPLSSFEISPESRCDAHI